MTSLDIPILRAGSAGALGLEEDDRLERPFDLALATIRGGRLRDGKTLPGISESESVIISITVPCFCVGRVREIRGEGDTVRCVCWGAICSFFFLGDFFSRSCGSELVGRLGFFV
jgi:hypothetical protein